MDGVKATLSRLLNRPQSSRPPLRPLRPSRVGLPAVAVAGVGPDGGEVTVAGLVSTGGEAVLLTFLTSSCQGCRQFWEGPAQNLPGTSRMTIVTPGPELEDRRQVAELAREAVTPNGVPVVMSAQAWADYDVTRSPFAVAVRDGRVAGEGPLFGWEDLHRLLAPGSGPCE